MEGLGLIVNLLLLRGQPRGKRLYFPPGEYIIGRGPECYVRPNSELVSRQHCLVRVGDHAASIADLGSRNGTLLNGTILAAETRLKHGDEVQVGPLVFRVIFDESIRLNQPREIPPAAPPADPPQKTMALAERPGPG
jgi:pSer/pThr/pTyr-binding forkhead associated (FHA) protein